ncbi:hypothetical protein CRG98_011609 [Punica granatum]|uniref:Uncharacterized protein n=1 Tax=Punica granatum TaxID=22663 RepID=A0A2I0KIK6_PUNGR|nr:hypothetical protein CRG98_011609 [Punica granatum]
MGTIVSISVTARCSPGGARRRLPRRRRGAQRREPLPLPCWTPLLHPTSSSLLTLSLTGSAHLSLVCACPAQPIPPSPFGPVQSGRDGLTRSDVRPAPSHPRFSPERAAQRSSRPISHARGPVLRDPAWPPHARPNSPAQRPFQLVCTVQAALSGPNAWFSGLNQN